MARPTCRDCDEPVSRSADTCPHCGAVEPAERLRTIDCKDCKGLGTYTKGGLSRSHSSISSSRRQQKCPECRGSGLLRVPY